MTIADLKRYRRMTDEEREQIPEFKCELHECMRWMLKRWREIVRVRYINRRSVVQTCMELHIGKTTYLRRTQELAEWLEDTEGYLERQI